MHLGRERAWEPTAQRSKSAKKDHRVVQVCNTPEYFYKKTVCWALEEYRQNVQGSDNALRRVVWFLGCSLRSRALDDPCGSLPSRNILPLVLFTPAALRTALGSPTAGQHGWIWVRAVTKTIKGWEHLSQERLWQLGQFSVEDSGCPADVPKNLMED